MAILPRLVAMEAGAVSPLEAMAAPAPSKAIRSGIAETKTATGAMIRLPSQTKSTMSETLPVIVGEIDHAIVAATAIEIMTVSEVIEERLHRILRAAARVGVEEAVEEAAEAEAESRFSWVGYLSRPRSRISAQPSIA